MAHESRGECLIRRCIGQEIARKLLGDELREGLALVERSNHPRTPGVRIPAKVVLETARVGVARILQPAEREVFAKFG